MTQDVQAIRDAELARAIERLQVDRVHTADLAYTRSQEALFTAQMSSARVDAVDAHLSLVAQGGTIIFSVVLALQVAVIVALMRMRRRLDALDTLSNEAPATPEPPDPHVIDGCFSVPASNPSRRPWSRLARWWHGRRSFRSYRFPIIRDPAAFPIASLTGLELDPGPASRDPEARWTLRARDEA